MKTKYDPRGVGLLKLALDTEDLRHYGWQNLQVVGKSAFLETIAQLEEVFFVYTTAHGRQVLGGLSDLAVHEVYLNRSLPILSATPAFERLKRDPRLVANDLTRLYICKSRNAPMEMYTQWRRLIRPWSVPRSRTEYKALVAHIGHGQVSGRASAEAWLREEDDAWEAEGVPFARSRKIPPEDMTNAVKPAFGFWLFPIEAFGPFTEDGEPDYVRAPIVPGTLPRDVTGYWPELALSILP